MGEAVVWWHALLLGVVQGLTEFLPVSSSGHLAVAEALFGIRSGGLALVMLVHAGTLLSVALVFRDEVRQLARGTLGLPRVLARPYRDWPESERHAALAILATIPGALVGYFLEGAIETSFGQLAPIGWQFIATGAALLATKWVRPGTREVSPASAILVGAAQALAILPAISRSGVTIAVALFLGVKRERAGEFSFVISVPIILGAVLLKVPELTGVEFRGQELALGLAFVVSFVVGWLSLLWLVRVIRHGRFHWFAPYCVLAGLVTLWIAHAL